VVPLNVPSGSPRGENKRVFASSAKEFFGANAAAQCHPSALPTDADDTISSSSSDHDAPRERCSYRCEPNRDEILVCPAREQCTGGRVHVRCWLHALDDIGRIDDQAELPPICARCFEFRQRPT